MRNPRDTYFSIKNGRNLTPDEKAQIEKAFLGAFQGLNYHDVLSFGLVFQPTQQYLSRAKEIINALIEQEEDDLLKAVLTTVCIYWKSTSDIIEEVRCVVRLDDFDAFGDAIIVAVKALASVANETKSEVDLEELKEIACKYLKDGSLFEAETYAEAALYAATGDRHIPSSYVKLCLKPEMLKGINFDFKLENIRIH